MRGRRLNAPPVGFPFRSLAPIALPASPSEGLRTITLRPGQKLPLQGGASLVAWSPSPGSSAPSGRGALLLVDSSGRIQKRLPAGSPVQQDSAGAVWVNVQGRAHLVGKIPVGNKLPAVQRPASAKQPR